MSAEWGPNQISCLLDLFSKHRAEEGAQARSLAALWLF